MHRGQPDGLGRSDRILQTYQVSASPKQVSRFLFLVSGITRPLLLAVCPLARRTIVIPFSAPEEHKRGNASSRRRLKSSFSSLVSRLRAMTHPWSPGDSLGPSPFLCNPGLDEKREMACSSRLYVLQTSHRRSPSVGRTRVAGADMSPASTRDSASALSAPATAKRIRRDALRTG